MESQTTVSSRTPEELVTDLATSIFLLLAEQRLLRTEIASDHRKGCTLISYAGYCKRTIKGILDNGDLKATFGKTQWWNCLPEHLQGDNLRDELAEAYRITEKISKWETCPQDELDHLLFFCNQVAHAATGAFITCARTGH